MYLQVAGQVNIPHSNNWGPVAQIKLYLVFGENLKNSCASYGLVLPLWALHILLEFYQVRRVV